MGFLKDLCGRIFSHEIVHLKWSFVSALVRYLVHHGLLIGPWAPVNVSHPIVDCWFLRSGSGAKRLPLSNLTLLLNLFRSRGSGTYKSFLFSFPFSLWHPLGFSWLFVRSFVYSWLCDLCLFLLTLNLIFITRARALDYASSCNWALALQYYYIIQLALWSCSSFVYFFFSWSRGYQKPARLT